MRGRSLRLDPDDPREGRLQLGRRLRRARPRARERRLRALRAQAPAPVRARRGRRDRGRARRTCTRSSARSRRRPSTRFARAQPRAARPRRPTATRRASAGRSATPYRGVELPTLLVRAGARRPTRGARDADGAAAPLRLSQRVPIAAASAARRVSRSLGVGDRRAAAARRPRARARRPRRGRPSGCGARASSGCRSCSRSTRAARAVADAYRELGELSDAEAAGSLAIEPRASGYLRCELTEATPEEGAQVRRRARRAGGASPTPPRYLVSRPLRRPRRRRARPARPRAHAPRRRSTSACTPSPPTSPATRSAPRRSRAPGAATSARAGSSSRSAATRAARRAPRRPSSDGGYETLVRDVWV